MYLTFLLVKFIFHVDNLKLYQEKYHSFVAVGIFTCAAWYYGDILIYSYYKSLENLYQVQVTHATFERAMKFA